MSQVPCPFCSEPIQAEALKCRHCRRMLDGKPRGSAFPGADFWGPVLVIVGVFGAGAWLLRPSANGSEAFVGPDPAAIARSLEEPSVDGGPPSAPNPSPASAPVGQGPELGGAPEVPPEHWRARFGRNAPPAYGPAAEGSTQGSAATASPVGPFVAEPIPPSQPSPPIADDTPGPPLDVRHPWFGYGAAAPNALRWQLGFSGASRHVVVRNDETARFSMWVEAQPATATANAARCLADHLKRLDARLSRGGLKVRKGKASERAGRGGLAIELAERDAKGRGPRRDAGRYLVAFAASGHLCFAFEGFAGQSAPKAAWKDVRAAAETFDVSTSRLQSSATTETRKRIEGAIGSPAFAQLVVSGAGPAALLDAGSAIAGLWPGDATGWGLLGSALLASHRAAEATGMFERALSARDDLGGEEGRIRRMGLFLGLADANAMRKRWGSAEEALAKAKGVVPDHPHIPYAEACLFAQRNLPERAMDALEASLRAWPVAASPPRFPHALAAQVRVARLDSRLRSLRGEPRFEVLLRQFEARARKAGGAP